MSEPLRSPVTGRALTPDTPHSIAAPGERWPVIDDIAFLRTGRDALVADVLACLDRGQPDAALALLLGEQDDWWGGPSADADRLAILVRERETLTFREAMDHLGFGRVGDYLAHRWSDPTYLAGLALLEAHWTDPPDVFELACGTGPYLRELARRGVRCSGGDVVFAKLWLARHWVVGSDVELVCFDAASPWPIAGRRHGLVFCHDAFYFLQPQHLVAERLRAATVAGGLLAVAHIHGSGVPNLSSGAAMSAIAIEALFPNCTIYDDAELTRALIEARAPRSCVSEAMGVEAFSLASGDPLPPRPVLGGLAVPPADALLRKNPLYGDDDRIIWPSERYREEYAARATYPEVSRAPRSAYPGPATETSARSRELVDLPDRW